jgi:hypothetical protein
MYKVFQDRNNKIIYYINGYFKIFYPKCLLTLNLDKLQKSIKVFDEDAMFDRVDYYNKLESNFVLDKEKIIKDISTKQGGVYSLDLMEYTRYFSQEYKISYLFGDITNVPDIPSIVKSRPVANNINSILINMNKVRHFYFVSKDIKFKNKNNKLVWRGAVYRDNRIQFMKKFFKKSDLIDVGDFSNGRSHYPQWHVPFMSIKEQLQNKFILAIEGNDVATSTKWIMSSNSLCFMTKPKYETWFMEGRLIPNHHYVLVKDDYSDLEEKVEYYIDNSTEAEAIVINANKYIEQFRDKKSEDWLHFKVLEKYFKLSGQM